MSNFDIIARARTLCVELAGPADEVTTTEVYGSIEVVDILSSEVLRLRADNAALRAQIAEAIRLYPQLAERITSSAPDPSFGNPRTP